MLLYIIGVLLPPLGILFYGRIVYAAFNALLWTYAIVTPGIIFVLFGGFILWTITIVHAVIVVHGSRSDARTQKIVDAINSNKEN